MVRIAVLNQYGLITQVYEAKHFASLGLMDDPTIEWVMDKNMESYEGGTYIDGIFTPPPPCEDCMKAHGEV